MGDVNFFKNIFWEGVYLEIALIMLSPNS